MPLTQGSHKMVREAFRREETNSRCEDESLKKYVRDLRGQHDLDRGIVNNTGKKWHEQVRIYQYEFLKMTLHPCSTASC